MGTIQKLQSLVSINTFNNYLKNITTWKHQEIEHRQSQKPDSTFHPLAAVKGHYGHSTGTLIANHDSCTTPQTSTEQSHENIHQSISNSIEKVGISNQN